MKRQMHVKQTWTANAMMHRELYDFVSVGLKGQVRGNQISAVKRECPGMSMALFQLDDKVECALGEFGKLTFRG